MTREFRNFVLHNFQKVGNVVQNTFVYEYYSTTRVWQFCLFRNPRFIYLLTIRLQIIFKLAIGLRAFFHNLQQIGNNARKLFLRILLNKRNNLVILSLSHFPETCFFKLLVFRWLSKWQDNAKHFFCNFHFFVLGNGSLQLTVKITKEFHFLVSQFPKQWQHCKTNFFFLNTIQTKENVYPFCLFHEFQTVLFKLFVCK